MRHPSDPHNPRWYNKGAGTPRFRAPEQSRQVDRDTLQYLEEWQLTSKTNVFGVGIIIWCLVNRSNDPPEPVWLGNGNIDTSLRVPATFPAYTYSDQLRDLIHDCVQYDPANRPTFRGLLNDIRTHTSEDPGARNLASGMRSGRASVWARWANRVEYIEDRYRLGLHRGQVP